MFRDVITLLGCSMLLGGCWLHTGSTAHQVNSSGESQYITRAYFGKCVTDALNEKLPEDILPPADAISGLIASVAPSLISKGLDLVSASLKEFSSEQTNPTKITYAIDENNEQKYQCIQLVSGGTPGVLNVTKKSSFSSSLSTSENKRLSDAYIFLSDSPDMFLEFWIRTSGDGTAIAIVPTMLYYKRHLYDGKQGRRGLIANLKFSNIIDSNTNSGSHDASVVLGDFDTSSEKDSLHRFGFVVGRQSLLSPGTSSKWIPSPFLPTGGRQTTTPLNLEITLNEVRDPKPVLAFLGEVLEENKSALQEELELALIRQKRDQAAVNAAKARSELLNTYAQNLATADETAAEYCTPGGNRRSKSAKFLAAQLIANTAAEGAEVPLPFPTVVVVNDDEPDQRFCS